MSNKNYKVVNLKTTTPENTDTSTTVYGRYNEKGEFVPDGRTFNTYSESVAPPSAEAVQYFNETVRPMTEKQHGLEFDDKGNLTTPLSRFVHFDPEKERQRREQEQKLNEWKRKEANWYNGISVLMDIATAAGGGKVGKRTPSDAAAQAVADNERLRKEQQAEDYAVQKVKQDKLAAFYSDLNEKYKALQDKVRQEASDKPPMQITQKTTSDVVSYRQQAVRNGGNGGNGSRGSSNARYMRLTVRKNGQTEDVYIPMNIGKYNNILGNIKSHYKKLLQGENKAATEQFLINQGIIDKIQGKTVTNKGKTTTTPDKIIFNDDIIMSNGTFFSLPYEIKKEIIESTGDNYQIISNNGIDIILPKGAPTGWNGLEIEEKEQYDD